MVTATTRVRCGSAPPRRPAPPLSSTLERPRSRSKATKAPLRQLPPKTPSHVNNAALSSKKRRVPIPKTTNALRKEDKHNDCNTGSKSSCSVTQLSRELAGKVALSRTESILVSEAGDFIVCRCRRSSTPFIPTKARDALDVWDQHFPCCDTELLTNIDGPWSPVLENLTAQKKREGRARTGSVSQISTNTEFSTYEWEKCSNGNSNTIANNILGVNGLKGGSLTNSNYSQVPLDSLVTDFSSEQRVGRKSEKVRTGNTSVGDDFSENIDLHI